jgi:hypothetical protein
MVFIASHVYAAVAYSCYLLQLFLHRHVHDSELTAIGMLGKCCSAQTAQHEQQQHYHQQLLAAAAAVAVLLTAAQAQPLNLNCARRGLS